MEADFAILMGEDVVETAFWLPGIRGTSKKLPGCEALLTCCDSDDEPLDVFRRS